MIEYQIKQQNVDIREEEGKIIKECGHIILTEEGDTITLEFTKHGEDYMKREKIWDYAEDKDFFRDLFSNNVWGHDIFLYESSDEQPFIVQYGPGRVRLGYRLIDEINPKYTIALKLLAGPLRFKLEE